MKATIIVLNMLLYIQANPIKLCNKAIIINIHVHTVEPLYYGHHSDHTTHSVQINIKLCPYSEVVQYTSLYSWDNRKCSDQGCPFIYAERFHCICSQHSARLSLMSSHTGRLTISTSHLDKAAPKLVVNELKCTGCQFSMNNQKGIKKQCVDLCTCTWG